MALADKISAARKEGISDQEIVNYILENKLSTKVSEAVQTGASATEILDVATASRGPIERASRIPGLIARGAMPSAIGAVAGAPFGPPGMLAGAVAVPAAEALSQLYNLIAPQQYQMAMTPMQAIEKLGTQIGLPKAETLPEQAIQAASGAVGGVMSQIPGAARLAQTAATPMGRQAAETFAARPGAQITGAAVGAPTGEVVSEVTGSPIVGMLAGMAAGGAAGARRGEPEVAPTRAAVQAESQGAYQRATQAGVIVTPQSLQNAITGIEQRVRNAGYDEGLHPRVTAVLNRLAQEGQQPRTLDELEILRRVASGAAASNERDERRIARLIVNQIDDYINNIRPADLIAGNQAGVNELRDARRLWSMNAKAGVFEEMIRRAETTAASVQTQSGYENALRGEFRRLANNQTRMRQFTQSEQDQITQIARGGTLQNMLRMIGKFSPTSVISTPLSAGTGFVLGGPVGAVAVPAVGRVARTASERMMQQQVDELINQILLGRPQQRGAPTYFNIPASGASTQPVEVE